MYSCRLRLEKSEQTAPAAIQLYYRIYRVEEVVNAKGELMAAPTTDTDKTLCVDMDGTLLATDVLWESLLIFLKANPLNVLLLPLWLFKGKAFFKRQLAQRVVLNPALLPYREDVLNFLKRERESGREIILATASDQHVAEDIANYVQMFSAVLGSDGERNLSGPRKLKALEEYLGDKSFDYMGNASNDVSLFQAAHRAILVHPSSRLLKDARRISLSHRTLSPRTNPFPSLINAIRAHHWIKNTLVFVPLILAHRVTELGMALQAAYAFLAFSLCASSIYIVNDLLDVESDRQHPYKKHRPFAAGMLQLQSGLLLVPILLGSSLAIAIPLLPPFFTAALALYLLLNTSYSFFLKRVPILDVLVLAGLYTIRILSGGIAVGVTTSPWLLALSMVFFVSLAFMKRYAELRWLWEE